jgi:hypothetical protein
METTILTRCNAIAGEDSEKVGVLEANRRLKTHGPDLLARRLAHQKPRSEQPDATKDSLVPAMVALLEDLPAAVASHRSTLTKARFLLRRSFA